MSGNAYFKEGVGPRRIHCTVVSEMDCLIQRIPTLTGRHGGGTHRRDFGVLFGCADLAGAASDSRGRFDLLDRAGG